MTAPAMTSIPPCPKCGGECWDETKSKFYKPGKPIAKCKDKACGGTVDAAPAPVLHQSAPAPAGPPVDFATLCTRYAECVGYVVKQIAPGLVKHDIGADSATIAAMSACLFIERNRRNV